MPSKTSKSYTVDSHVSLNVRVKGQMCTNVGQESKCLHEEVSTGKAVASYILNSYNASLTLLGRLIQIDLFVRLQHGLKSGYTQNHCKQQ